MALPGELPVPPAPRVRPLRTLVRSRVLRLATRVPSARMAEWRAAERGLGPALLDVAERIVRSGPIQVAAGPAVGGLLPTGLLTVDHAQAGLLVRGSVEPPFAEALRRHLPAGGAFWDVGANLGYFALLGARLGGEGTQVVAVDPVPAHARSVVEIAALNRLSDIHALQLAAWREPGEVELVLPADGAWAHLAATVAGRAPGDRLTVQAIALDALLDPALGLRPPDVVKIDVEGAELGVLAGLERTVAAHRPVLLVETHDTADPVAAWAAEHGYRVENLERPAPIAGLGGQLAALVPAA
ncbi:FkbM family methyltransferase [Patulibacter defluvii]|uniref:FkbM family methyltransferase n=1 Tax=Patulibacter defluvii TaxID=3095358 RepID=UPI002A757015|nr:FkbM family methyltransferase [Patulibacter sp. DM4]